MMQDEKRTPFDERENASAAEEKLFSPTDAEDKAESDGDGLLDGSIQDYSIEEFEGTEPEFDFSDIVDDIRDSKANKRKKKKKGGCLGTFIYVTAVCLVSVLLTGLFLYCANDIFAVVKPDEKVTVYIEQNWSTKQIAHVLKERGVINSELLFRFYSKISESDGKYQYGEYVLNKKYDYSRIAHELKKIAPKRNEVRITFPEGITANEIIDKLVKEVGCDRERLLKAMNEDKFGYSLVDDLPANEHRYIKLEGYLFPDTYDFFVGEPEHDAVKRFLDNFIKKWTDEFQQRAEELGFTVDEVINIASMIQKEAKHKEDFPLVSSVFHNRLNKPGVYPNLQMDSTIDYCTKFIEPYLLTGDPKRYNAYYNTYKCKGLPAGPISNPGLDAIRATLYPEETDYYYFVSDKYGKNYYGRTLLEHNKNIQTAKSVK